MEKRYYFEEYVISTDPDILDIPFIHQYLNEKSYWAKGIDQVTVETSIQHSLCFGLYVSDETGYLEQIGFARVVTDHATFGYLADVFITDIYRGNGLSKWMMRIIQEHPSLQRLRSFLLFTKDAHGLYEQFGFSTLDKDLTSLMAIRQKAVELY